MAIRIVMNIVCDRCMKPFEGKSIEYGDSVPEVERTKLTLVKSALDPKTGETVEEVLFSVKDLCPSCKGVVDKAVETIKMSPPKGVKGAKKKRRNGITTTAVKEPKEGEPKPDLPPPVQEEPPPQEGPAEEPPPEESPPEEDDTNLF